MPKGGKVYEKDWPKNASALIRKLTEISSSLADLGVVIELSRGDERTVTIRTTGVEGAKNAVGGVGAVESSYGSAIMADATDGNDGIIGTSTPAFDMEVV